MENWQRELQHLYGIFEHESIVSLRKITQFFLASGEPFDENFRQHFLKNSALKLETSFNTVLFEHKRRMQKTSDSSASTNDSRSGNNTNVLNSNVDGTVAVTNGPVLSVKIENSVNAPIEIADSDDENDNEIPTIPVANDRNDEQMASNECRELNNDTESANHQHIDIDLTIENGDDHVEVDVKQEPKVESPDEMPDLPFIEFDPNEGNETSSEDEDEVQSDYDYVPNQSTSSSAQNQFVGKRFKCKSCTYATNRKDSLNRHKLIHEGEASKRFKCVKCDYAARYKHDLDKHQRIHVGQKLIGIARDPNSGMYKCTRCTEQFKEAGILSKHLTKSHKNNRRLYNCVRCLRRFSRQDKKEKHEIQCKNRRYECHLCQKFAAKKFARLQMHMRIHSGAKPFECAICNKHFSVKSNLKAHLDSVHGRINA